MRITEFAVDKYGPLKGTGRIETGPFNLFFGRNENGKTLTIDALIKFLIGKRTKDFDKIDRVPDSPDGYIKIEINAGTEKNLPYDGDLPKITKVFSSPLTPADCRNIFIIRNSDLFLAGEREFFTGVTDRLVGLRTFDLKKIKRNLLEMGSLTPNMDFRDDEKSFRLKSRMKDAENLITRIESVKERLFNGRYDTLEIDLYKKTSELAGVNEMTALFEDAKKREMFEKSSELLKALENKISSLKDMEILREEDFAAWQDSEREIKRCGREQNELREKYAEVKKNLSVIEEQAKELKDQLNIINNKKRRIDEERINIRRLEEAVAEIESDSGLRNLLKRISVLSGILTLAIVASWFFKASVYLYAAGILSLLITSFLWIYEIIINRRKKKALKEFAEIRLKLAEDLINGESIEAIFNALGKFNDDYEKIKSKNMESESGLVTVERHLSEIEHKLLANKSIANEYEKKIYSIQTKYGLNTLAEFGEKLKAKRTAEKEKEGLSNRLEGMLEIHGRSMGESLSGIKAKIHELESFRGKAKGIEFDEYKYNDLRGKSRILEDDISKIREKKNQFETGMAQIEADVNDIIINNDEKIYCKTLVDLDEVLTRLNDFIIENKIRRDAITGAAEIVDDIGRDETDRVVDLFDGNLSALFSTITHGNYKKVIYDRETEGGAVRVIRENGEIMNSEKLSGGAYDQLYLAIRIALGEKILNPEKGFFIMDDPFIKSDIERIKAQFSALKKICDTGWQILYFTCKNEIKDILSDDIKKGKINFFEIKWIK